MLWLPETLSSAQAELPPAATEIKNKVIYSECLHATEQSGLVASSWGVGEDLEALAGLETSPGWGSPVQEGCSALPEGCCVMHAMEFVGKGSLNFQKCCWASAAGAGALPAGMATAIEILTVSCAPASDLWL